MKPIMSGASVEGVTVNPSDIETCKEMKAKHQAKK